MIFSFPFGNGKDFLAMKERQIKPKQKANMLSSDCVGEILAPLKSTEMLTFISPWTSKCNTPSGHRVKNLKMDGQPLTKPTKPNVHHRNTSAEKKNPLCFHQKMCHKQLGIC